MVSGLSPANGKRVRLYSRPGNDLTARFPLIVEALSRLRSRSPQPSIGISPSALAYASSLCGDSM
jgi:hypothetical protein